MAVKRINPVTGSDAATATKRRSGSATAAVHTSIGSCDVVDMREMGSLAVLPPVGVTSLTVYACDTEDGTFRIVNDVGTAGVVTVTASVWQSLPGGVAAYSFLKLLSAGSTGNATITGKS